MLEVVGGTYRERCTEPEWDQIFGSGLRAAGAVSSQSLPVRYTTYIGDNILEDFHAYAASFGLTIRAEPLQRSPTFNYAHPMAEPLISPLPHLIQRGPPLQVAGEAVLRFGMLEGTAVVQGERVVYDPQSAYEPELFATNGSSARALAVLANQHETELLTGQRDWEGATALLELSGASVVVVKRGARGLMVVTPTSREEIPAYETNRIFPIGSGDVFAAVFAAEWAVRQRLPGEAATIASHAVAHYVQSPKNLPLSPTKLDAKGPDALKPLHLVPPGPFREVYLAGPFFTMAQRWLVHEARDALRGQGVKVFSPYHDVGIGDAADVVPKDIEALNRCHALFAIVDGHDAGTLFEIGYARSINKPVVAFAQHEPDEALKMLLGTGCEVLTDFTTAVYHSSWAALRAT